jgi:TonB family protein
MHNRIHPIFAEQFLATLEKLPANDVLNRYHDLSTRLEIVIQKDTGKVVRMGVTKSSGVTAFDVAALEAVDRASPFDKAPDIIASPDGNVYVHWEFHRDPSDACSTRNVRPFMLQSAP